MQHVGKRTGASPVPTAPFRRCLCHPWGKSRVGARHRIGASPIRPYRQAKTSQDLPFSSTHLLNCLEGWSIVETYGTIELVELAGCRPQRLTTGLHGSQIKALVGVLCMQFRYALAVD